MVAETHPHDIELFEYVEDELPQERRDEIATHLATCRACAEQVELASAGRKALRGTELLELPDARREEILRSLPRQDEASRERHGFFSKELLVGIALLLVLAAFTAVLVRSGGNSGLESSAGGTAAEDATATGGGGGTGGGQAAEARSALFSSGPAAAVAEDLRHKGFDAVVEKDRVVVHGATKRQVREALADRAPGDVEVVVKNP
jgi:anti-sigma factor RsiW